jgi:poly-gamma-glutamate synthesis protein (capsule biosynthesis protein)
MRILFTGDINFRGIEDLTKEAREEILSELKPYLAKVDFRIPNLETPLAQKNKYEPIKKSGPNLICPPENIIFLKAFQADGVTLANNHIGDYGEGATKDTLTLLDENGIMYAGAGANIRQAYKAMYLKKDGICVAIVSVCENEFGIATEEKYGSAGYNPRLLLRQIKEEKEKADYVIVVFHGGNEYNPLPSPETVDRYRFICDMGADAVIRGHTHCPQPYELYNGKPIVYSMGNLLFKNVNKMDCKDSWYYGYISILDIGNTVKLQIIPYKFDKEVTKITIFQGESKEIMTNYIDNLCEILQDKENLSNHFKGWVWSHKWVPRLPSENGKSGWNVAGDYNLVYCESHFSLVKEIFHVLFNEETPLAEKYAVRIRKLQEMPV